MRSEFVAVRGAKERLETMHVRDCSDSRSGWLRIRLRCCARFWRRGTLAKASRALETPEATVRAMVRRWREKGKEYRAMVDLVRWRKKVGRKEKLPLKQAIVHESVQSADYPALLSDVLDGLLSMTEENWAERCEELAEMLRGGGGRLA